MGIETSNRKRGTSSVFVFREAQFDAARALGRTSPPPRAMSTPGRGLSHGGIRWEPPSSVHIDELENVATHNAYPAPAVTPGRGILKTPGRVKTPAASAARTPKAWNNNPNANHRVTSPENVGVSNAGWKTPGAAKMAQFAKTPARTPGMDAHASRPMSVFNPPGAAAPAATTTPARLSAASRTPGAGATTPGGSLISRAPARVAVDAGAKTPTHRRYRQLMTSHRGPKTPGDPRHRDGDDGPAAVLKTLPNATQAAYWLRRAAREEHRGNFEEAMSFLEQGIKRHARPSEELVDAKATLEEKMTRMNDASTRMDDASADDERPAATRTPIPAVAPAKMPSAASAPLFSARVGPSPAEKHCDAAIDKLDAILRSPKPLTLASLRASAKKAAREDATPPTPPTATPPSATVTFARGATPSTAAYVLQRQLTPNSEFAALETVVAAEAEERRRVAEEDALAAKEASMAMLMRQESVRASFTASPRSRPPKSPGAKASALSRTASVASATVLGTPPARVAVRSSSVEACNESPRISSSEIGKSEMLSPGTMLPSLPTPTAEIPAAFNASFGPGPGPSPGKAAREACEKEGMSPTAAVADAVARATPGSVETRRGSRRSSRSPTVSLNDHPKHAVPSRLVSPRLVPLPKTPHGEPRSFATPAALSAVTPIAPNAARRIATPGKGKGGSPLSVFARMMAKVIVDAADEQTRTPERTSAAETVSAALADTPEK